MNLSALQLDLINEYLRVSPLAGRRRISKDLNLPEGTVGRALRRLREGDSNSGPEKEEGSKYNFKETSGEAEITSSKVVTLNDLIAHGEVNLKIWEVERFTSNKSETVVRDPSGTSNIIPRYQIKAFFKRRRSSDLTPERLRELVKSAVVGALAVKVCPRPCKLAVDDPHMLEVSLPDIHVGKLVWGAENGGKPYDSKIALELAITAATNLWNKAGFFAIDRVLLPLGSDLWNTDNSTNTTTAGTPQDSDSRWQKVFSAGVELAIALIEMHRGKTPGGVDVLMIPGNHDGTRTFYAGVVLEERYRNCPDVRINNSPNPRKYFRFGTNLLGFTHGDKEKHDKLPMLLATECPKDWFETTHREFHVGHLHQMRETRYVAGIEHGAVRVRILPSLSGCDAWHHSSGYVGSRRAAEAYVWSFKNGYVGHFSHSVA
jgi:hypothetical protein